MKRHFLIFSLILLSYYELSAQITFSKTINKAGNQVLFSARQCTDNGYIVAGYEQNSGQSDIIVLKLNEFSEKEWSYQYDGCNQTNPIIQTTIQ
ncbi:MAG: hypothetical protein IPL35_06840 [Sphingobacteriales bacterium]|nr:hypothetical protein [Sphingobacteriales bacterium]